MRFCGGGPCGGGLNSSWCMYPLFLNASWYSGAASLKTARSDQMLDSRRLIAAGMFEGTFEWDIEVLLCPFPVGNKFCPVKWTKMFVMILGGWFDWL